MMTKRVSRLALCLLMALSLLAGALPAALAAEDLHGFKLVEQSQFTLVNAEASLYEHEKTGALLLVLENEDTNRTFDISFRTPVHDDMGVPHVFEHATLGGSRKYPSKSLFFNLSLQTYNTYMNAMTTDIMTTYPVASLSEDQLLRYADYYTESVLNPMLMEDSSIFEEEAWRYAMSSEDGKLEMAGTVYTEMKGAYTIQTAARFNFLKTIFPGSMIGNSFGGDPQHIPERFQWRLIRSGPQQSLNARPVTRRLLALIARRTPSDLRYRQPLLPLLIPCIGSIGTRPVHPKRLHTGGRLLRTRRRPNAQALRPAALFPQPVRNRPYRIQMHVQAQLIGPFALLHGNTLEATLKQGTCPVMPCIEITAVR